MNNVHIPIPRRKRSNPGWLIRVARWIGECRTIFADYRHFRAQGLTRKAARFNALNTPTLSARKIAR